MKLKNYYRLYFDGKMTVEEAYASCNNVMYDLKNGFPELYDAYKEQLANLSIAMCCLHLVHNGYDFNDGKFF